MVEEGNQISSTADVCQTCGHAGFMELLLCCNKCHISREHRYCLAVLADEDEYIYTCPQCTPTDAKQTCYKPPLPNAPPFRTFLRTNKRQVQNLKKSQLDHSYLTTMVEAEVQRNDNLVPETDQRKRQANTISSPAEMESPVKRWRKADDCLEESDEEPTCIDAKEPQVEQPEVELVELVETKRSPMKHEEIEDEQLQEALVERVVTSKRKRSLIDDEEIEDQQDPVKRKRSSNDDKEIEGHELQVDPVKRKRSSSDDNEIKSQEPQPSQIAQVEPVKRKRSSIYDEENKDQELQVPKFARLDIQSPRPVIGSHNYVYAQPIIDSAWRGYFEIGKENFGRLEGHLSNKACLKAFEAAKVMPEVISVKIIPRREAWPKSFNASSPTDENIALYFFPGIISAVKAFDQRTRHIIERDLAMKVSFDNAELLIFPSTQLPLLLRRFNGKHYLWGVFKGREASSGESGDTKNSNVCSSKKISVDSLRTSPVSPLNYSSN